MRTLHAIALILSASLAAPEVALAQDAGEGILTDQKSEEVLSDSYLGADVVVRTNEGLKSIGSVSDLVLDGGGKIVGVVVDVGGILGVGAKPVGLSWASLTEEKSEKGLILKTSLTPQDFEAAPEYKTLQAKQLEEDQKSIDLQKQTDTPSPSLQQ